MNGTKTYFLYDEATGDPAEEYSASGGLVARDAHAPDGLVGQKKSSAWTFYAFDPQGSVAQRTSSTGTVLSNQAYDAYGTESSTGTPAERFGFNARWGYYLDRDTGLYDCENRYYDPASGRWVTRDPIGYEGGVNLYAYCGGGPVGAIDPLGLSVWGWGDDRWVEFSAWFSGRDAKDPNGHPARIGGWPAMGNAPNNGMTISGTIHFKDEASYKKYLRNPHWQNHEEGHIQQGFSPKDFVKYGICAAIGTLHEYMTPNGKPSRDGPYGHDYNWFEWDAEVRAQKKDGVWDFGSPRYGL